MADLIGGRVPQVPLTSVDYESLVRVFEALKSQGIDPRITLSRIVMCGDVSSGKSSLLEALTGREFPIKGNLCTRYPIELVMKKDSEASVEISIVPAGNRSATEKEQLESFTAPASALNNISLLVQSVNKTLGLRHNGKTLLKDKLKITLSGPSQPSLTMIDLPGLYCTHGCSVHPTDLSVANDISYSKNLATIVLAVVPGPVDYESQVIARFFDMNDDMRKRTIGIITKPDLVQAGSERERAAIALAAGREHHFGFGWHVVKNRDYNRRLDSEYERDASEDRFFSDSAWASLPSDQLGIGSLRARLIQILKDQISMHIPTLIIPIESHLGSVQKDLQALGDPRPTRIEQQLYLCRIGQ
jgi:GTPase SAR1 family protein